jgi:hypothetical protein
VTVTVEQVEAASSAQEGQIGKVWRLHRLQGRFIRIKPERSRDRTTSNTLATVEGGWERGRRVVKVEESID